MASSHNKVEFVHQNGMTTVTWRRTSIGATNAAKYRQSVPFTEDGKPDWAAIELLVAGAQDAHGSSIGRASRNTGRNNS